MKNKIFRLPALIFTAILLCTSLVSCGDVEYTEDEIKETAKTLIEASFELNEIYFGEGLASGGETSISSSLYSPVSEDCKYRSTTEIKAATQKVYTEDYCKLLFKRGFEGSSLEDDTNVVYARYIDDFDGRLTVRKNLGDEALKLGRTYDFSTAKAEKMKKDEAQISVVSLVDGKTDVTVTFTLRLEKNGWRLDTPTY